MPVPTMQDLMQFGALGVVLSTFVALVWKGLPAFKAWLDALIVTFKEEIREERERGEQRLKDEREAASIRAVEQLKVITPHTEALNAALPYLRELAARRENRS